MVVCVTPDHPDLAVEALVEEPIYVYAPDAAAAATPDEWGPWVSFPTGSSTRSLIESALREMGATFDVVAESHQPEVLREMVRLGMGWTALPPAQAERPPDALRPVLSQPLVHRELAAVTRRHAIVHPAAARLIEVLRGA